MKTMKLRIFTLIAFAMCLLSLSASTNSDVTQVPEETGTPMRIKVTIINLIGIKLSPCLLSPIAEVTIYQHLSGTEQREVQYLCPEDRSEVIYVTPGQTISVQADLLGRELFFTKDVVLDSSMISNNGIIDVSFTVDIEL